MDLNPFSRRTFLAVAGIGAASSLAGCLSLGGNDDDSPSITDESGQDGAEDPSDDRDLYDRSIDSVPLVRALGVDTGMSDGGGQGQGSGFVVDGSYVITNEHVVSGATEVDIQYTTGEWASTTVVGTDVRADLAVLEPEHVPDQVPSLAFADTQPMEGREVKAVGNPFGLIVISATVYRCDRTASCGRYRNDSK
jgi:serine protease Do